MNAQLDPPGDRLAQSLTLLFWLDPMGQGIAQQMLKRGHHPVQHLTIEFGLSAADFKHGGLPERLGTLPHHASQARTVEVECHHPSVQQILLNPAGQSMLVLQGRFGRLLRTVHQFVQADKVGHAFTQTP